MKLAFALDEGPRTRLGLIVLHVDETVETEFRALLRDHDADLYCARIPSGTMVTSETLAAMAEHIPAAARLSMVVLVGHRI